MGCQIKHTRLTQQELRVHGSSHAHSRLKMREGEGNVEIEMLELLVEYLMKAIERLARPEAVRSPFPELSHKKC